MFPNVKTLEFFFFVNPYTERDFKYQEEDKGCGKTDSAISEYAYQLDNERVVSTEDADSQGAPNTADEMYGNGTNRIIKFYAIDYHDRGHNQKACNKTDNDSAHNTDNICTGSNTDQAGQGTVEGHGQVRFFLKDPAQQYGADNTGCSSQTRCNKDKRDHSGISRKDRAAVETEPAKPKKEDTDGCQWHVVTHNRLNFAAHIFAKAGSKQYNACQGCPAAHGMNQCGSCKIIEALGVQPASAPFPAADPGVYKSNIDDGKNQK